MPSCGPLQHLIFGHLDSFKHWQWPYLTLGLAWKRDLFAFYLSSTPASQEVTTSLIERYHRKDEILNFSRKSGSKLSSNSSLYYSSSTRYGSITTGFTFDCKVPLESWDSKFLFDTLKRAVSTPIVALSYSTFLRLTYAETVLYTTRVFNLWLPKLCLPKTSYHLRATFSCYAHQG